MESIIGITGTIGSGKTTSAKYLTTFGYEEYSFAGPIKEIGEVFHFTFEELYGTQSEKLAINKYWGISGREFMQKFGTELIRNQLSTVIPEIKLDTGESIWTRLFEIELDKNPNKKYVVSDVRFLDEARSIRNSNGVIVKIERDENEHNLDSKVRNHSSERELQKIKPDYIIPNNRGLKHLKNCLNVISMSVLNTSKPEICINCGSIIDFKIECYYREDGVVIFEHNPTCVQMN